MKHKPDPTIYSATFRGLKPHQGKLNMAVPGEFRIEVFQEAQRWYARYVDRPRSSRIPVLKAMHHEDAKAGVELMFEKQIEPWSEVNQ